MRSGTPPVSTLDELAKQVKEHSVQWGLPTDVRRCSPTPSFHSRELYDNTGVETLLVPQTDSVFQVIRRKMSFMGGITPQYLKTLFEASSVHDLADVDSIETSVDLCHGYALRGRPDDCRFPCLVLCLRHPVKVNGHHMVLDASETKEDLIDYVDRIAITLSNFDYSIDHWSVMFRSVLDAHRAAVAAAAQISPKASPGASAATDWECAACHAWNADYTVRCTNCGSPRAAIAAPAVPMSPPSVATQLPHAASTPPSPLTASIVPQQPAAQAPPSPPPPWAANPPVSTTAIPPPSAPALQQVTPVAAVLRSSPLAAHISAPSAIRPTAQPASLMPGTPSGSKNKSKKGLRRIRAQMASQRASTRPRTTAVSPRVSAPTSGPWVTLEGVLVSSIAWALALHALYDGTSGISEARAVATVVPVAVFVCWRWLASHRELPSMRWIRVHILLGIVLAAGVALGVKAYHGSVVGAQHTSITYGAGFLLALTWWVRRSASSLRPDSQ
jgi:hypothetical protein